MGLHRQRTRSVVGPGMIWRKTLQRLLLAASREQASRIKAHAPCPKMPRLPRRGGFVARDRLQSRVELQRPVPFGAHCGDPERRITSAEVSRFRMLVCSANWLLTDGSLSRRPAVRDVWALIQWLRAVAARAGFRSDGRYQPVDRVDLVLAGDTLDMLTSTRWHDCVRPWHTTETANQRRRTIAHESMRRGRRVVAVLRQLHQRGLSVPSATPLMRPSTTCQSHVPVRIAILAGDRDQWILRFGQEPSQLPWVPAAWTRWGEDAEVVIAHGHRFDPAAACSMTTEPRPPSVAESLAVDLVVPFLSQLRRKKLRIVPRSRRGFSPGTADLALAVPHIRAGVLRKRSSADRCLETGCSCLAPGCPSGSTSSCRRFHDHRRPARRLAG